jgi:hypothetical protein
MSHLMLFQMYGEMGDGGVDSLEGDMHVPNQGSSPKQGDLEFNTLDEPIKTTVVIMLCSS